MWARLWGAPTSWHWVAEAPINWHLCVWGPWLCGAPGLVPWGGTPSGSAFSFSSLPLGAGSFRVVGSAGVHPYEAYAALSALPPSSLLLLAASLFLASPSPPLPRCLLSPSPRAHLGRFSRAGPLSARCLLPERAR